MKAGAKKKAAGSGRRASRAPAGRFFTLRDVAQAVGGRTVGDPATRLTGIEALERAGANDLSWIADSRFERQGQESLAGALLVASEESAHGKPAVVVENPAVALAQWMSLLSPPSRPRPGVSRRAHVHATARIGRGAFVAAGATVEAGARIGDRTVLFASSYAGQDCEIGADSILHPHAAVLERCRVGARCILYPGAVVGSDGFGYAWDGERHRKIPQRGIVRVEDDVEIGANAAIDRATLGETVIGRGTKIDNLVQIGHNVVIGENSIICGQAGIAGSARLGSRVTLAGQVGVNDHITIGEGTVATGQAGVTGDLPAGGVFSGMPAAPHREFLRRSAWFARLPELARRIGQLEKLLLQRSKGGKPWKSESPRS